MKKYFALFVFALTLLCFNTISSYASGPTYGFYTVYTKGNDVFYFQPYSPINELFVTYDGNNLTFYDKNNDNYTIVNGILNYSNSYNGYGYTYIVYPNSIVKQFPMEFNNETTNGVIAIGDSINPDFSFLPNSLPMFVDDGLGYDISLTHTEINIPLSSDYWEFVSVKNAWNYPTVRELSFDVYINGEKRDTINMLNNFGTNFGVAFNFLTSHYNAVTGDTIRILCIPLGTTTKGLARGVEWVIGSKENITISKIPNFNAKVDINDVSYIPTIQKEKQFIYNPTTNEYVTNNYYTQNYENSDLSTIESQLDYIIQYINNNPISSGSDSTETIINYNTTNKNYNFNFGDISFGDIDVDLEIGNTKEYIKHSFDEFVTNIQLLMDSPFEKIVIAFGVGIGLTLLILAIVIVAKILNIIIP